MRVNAFSAALLTLYAGVPALISLIEPEPLDTLTIRPWALCFSCGRRASVVRQAPNRFVSSASWTWSRSAVLASAHVS